jgi:hypothetical protein
MSQKPKPLSEMKRSGRGFELIEFKDYYGVPGSCSLQQSSIILGETDADWAKAYKHPGSSGVWFGLNDVAPRIMASKAAAHGVKTTETTGWVPFPVPEDVLFNTRFHLDRNQVESLVAHLQAWLKTGSLKI